MADRLDFCKELRHDIKLWQESDAGRKSQWRELLGHAPELFHLMCLLVADERVPAQERARLGSAIAYFVIPMDIIPEAVTGPLGFLDDLVVAGEALSGIEPHLLMKHWSSSTDIVQLLHELHERAEEIIGDNAIVAKLRKMVGR